MDKFQDVDFEEVKNKSDDKQIRGGALYYNTGQVAQILGVQDSKIRYYSKIFDDILKIEVINKQRKYKQSDIDKLKYMLELQEQGLSLRQIEEFCSEVSFEEDGKVKIHEDNPLSIKALAQMLMDNQVEQISLMKNEIMESIQENMLKQYEMNIEAMNEIKKQLALTVDEVVSDKLEEAKESNIKEFKRVNDELGNIANELQEIKKTAYVTAEEIVKQKKEPPNRLWKWFMGYK